MGNKLITFTDQQLVNYQDCTFFTRKEILRVYKKFREMKPDVIPRVMKKNEAYSIKLPVECTEQLAEFRENPFKQRIFKVFSRDSRGNLTFEDFLDMLSVFSEAAPRDIKVFYAFRIYDFDNDQFVGPADIDTALTLLTKQELTVEERQQITEKVIEESDVDGDGKLSYIEFEHCITRAPEFLSTFHIRI
ncbi:calcium and integrin-binding family member 2 isoform X1 [Dendroctonus ponderosae]|uniref:calcium and integrin-binding family member 2 isoform X1 n=1 Tax=Dendroctonus ponderosae TaxID=77166 RepID=UPI002034CF49|nr:calcium and integrin-binding family member 2 isoform X1 [Dendroctonus ponderosae]